MAKRKAGELPPISWTKNKGDLIWKLLAEVEKPEFRLVILGKKDTSENSSGMSKAAVFKAIGKIILPDLYAIDEDAVGQRVKCKYESVYGTYKKHCKRLRQTGGGLGGNDEDDESLHEYMSCYIPKDGPDKTTTPEAKNLWDAITKDFPFFPTFHRLYSTRPNVNPPVIITGVGPGGRRMVHLQPPSTSQPFLDEIIDPALLHRAATPPVFTPPGTPISGWGSSPVKVSTPTRTPLKENRIPSTASGASKPKLKVEAPNLSAAILKARQSVKKIPAKRSLEDTLVSLHEQTIKQAAKRAALQDDLAQRRLMLDEKAQLMEFHKMGAYSKEEFLAKLAEVDMRYAEATQPKPAKRARVSFDAELSSDVEVL